VAVTVFVFAVALFISFRSIVKPTETVKGKDVVVPGINVMDGEIFKQATEQLKANARQQELRDIMVRELHRELVTQSDLMRENRDTLRQVCEVLETIDRRLRVELKRQSEEREA